MFSTNFVIVLIDLICNCFTVSFIFTRDHILALKKMRRRHLLSRGKSTLNDPDWHELMFPLKTCGLMQIYFPALNEFVRVFQKFRNSQITFSLTYFNYELSLRLEWGCSWDFLKIQSSSRSCLPRLLCKKGVLNNFAKFKGKHQCWSLFFNKVAGLMPHSIPVRLSIEIRSGNMLFRVHFHSSV